MKGKAKLTEKQLARLCEQFESTLEERVQAEADRREEEAHDERVCEVEEALREEFEYEVLELAIEKVDDQQANERAELEELIERELREEFNGAHGISGASHA